VTDFLKSLLTDAYSAVEPEEKGGPTCEWCEEEKEYDDLVEVDMSDPSVGYYSTVLMCSTCRHKRSIERARGY